MTIHAYPDGTTATHPAALDARPTVAQQLGDVMDRAIKQTAIASTPEGEALSELLLWRETDRTSDGPQSDAGWMALQRLRDVADRLGAA